MPQGEESAPHGQDGSCEQKQPQQPGNPKTICQLPRNAMLTTAFPLPYAEERENISAGYFDL